jgi:hypothetical protein
MPQLAESKTHTTLANFGERFFVAKNHHHGNNESTEKTGKSISHRWTQIHTDKFKTD